jgi:exopolysaccharide biosynthesis polyprenyl glycosylphosphotransferase
MSANGHHIATTQSEETTELVTSVPLTRIRRRIRFSQARRARLRYLLADFVASYVVWIAFVVVRRRVIEQLPGIVLDTQQFVNAAIIATYWLIVYAVAGLYNEPLRRSPSQEFIQVFRYTLIGVLVIFFLIFLDDAKTIPGYQQTYYHFTISSFFGLQFAAVAFFRLILSTRTQLRIRSRALSFPTLLVGGGTVALNLYQELEGMRRSLGYGFKGFISLGDEKELSLRGKLKHFGDQSRLFHAIVSRRIEEVIIALEPSQLHRISEVIDICQQAHCKIKVVPSVYDYLMGSVKVNHILGAPLVEVFPQIMKPWEVVAKRAFDIFFSVIALIMLAPVYLIVAICIKLDSDGPILYSQERIGRGGRPFMIHKFRSMYQDAEKMGPQLSSDEDPRITRVGKVMRKLRIDELPQFWNVLVGDMSIVGPRPERQFFIDQIVKKAPHYRHLHKVRPGITSWGQVKYGYAENVDQMVRRLQFDILYLENMSFALDLRIILYTIIVMLEGRGK